MRRRKWARSNGTRRSCRSIFRRRRVSWPQPPSTRNSILQRSGRKPAWYLEELYLDKYSPDKLAEYKMDRELLGQFHPYAKDTMEEEVARCKIPPAELAAQLRDFAASVRLPANMDLFLVGSIDPDAAPKLVQEHFGKYAFAEGPRLEIPRVGVTRAYTGLTEASHELERPMTDLRIAWNTDVCVTSADARVLMALSQYLSTALFDDLREKDGDTYTPEVTYEPDACSGIVKISVLSSKDPERTEKKVFDIIDKMKADIDAKELSRLRDRVALKRRKEAYENETLVDCMVARTLDGASSHDLAVESVTREEVLAAARKYMPSYQQGVRPPRVEGAVGAPSSRPQRSAAEL